MKRFISIIICALLITATVTVGAYSTGSFKNGDVNRDGTLSVKDATEIQKNLAMLTNFDEVQTTLADTNLDNTVNIKDATLIQKVLAKLAEMPSEPTETATATESQTATESVTETATETMTETATETATATEPATEPAQPINTKIKISYRNSLKWSKVYFYFYNSDGKSQIKDWPGVTPASDGTYSGEDVYSYTVDVSKFDRVVFNNGTDKSMDVPISLGSTGFYAKAKGAYQGKYAVDTYTPSNVKKGKLNKTTLAYSTGYNKTVWVYTPSDYDPNRAEAYPTIYMMDGQNLFSDHKDSYGGWDVESAVEGLLTNTGRSAIVVGIDNGNSKRDSELTPNIGTPVPEVGSQYVNGTGKAYSDFVVNKVMPYVRANYNSSTKREENCVSGSSSGGLECFYIGMENKDKFGTIGALSPAFIIYDDATWNKYLSKYNFKDSSIPDFYIYCGGYGDLEKQLLIYTEQMNARLKKLGLPDSKFKYTYSEGANHNEQWWRLCFTEVLGVFMNK